MKNLPVRLDRHQLLLTFHLDPFIIEWEGARQAFVSCIAREFGDRLAVSPQDFISASSTDFGETWCRYRIFSGSRTITLRPDSLQFDFPALLDVDYPLLEELIGKGMEILLPVLGDYGRSSYTLASNRHVAVMEGSAEGYIARFANDGIASTVEGEPLVTYRPSARFILASDDKNRVLRRTAEQSEVLPNGLFIATHIFVAASVVTSFGEEYRWNEQMLNIADRAMGIEYQTEEADDKSSGQ